MIDLPPLQYDHPYPGKVIELRLGWDELQKYCNAGRVYACTKTVFLPNGICIIALPKVGPGGVSERTFLILYRHEIGHCNGWKHQLLHHED